jgi:Zn-dependent protease/predicted transcriptional regulator
MPDAWQIGRIFGIPLRVHFSWFIIFGLVSWSLAVGYFPTQMPDLPVWSHWAKAIVAAAMLFVSVILHELGHSIVARRRGVEIAGITLFVFGGVSQMKTEPARPAVEFQVAIVGPLVSVVLAGVFGLLAIATRLGPGATLAALFSYLAAINLMLAGFNLIPAFPLDGGRVLRAALWHVRGDLVEATRAAAAVGRIVALAIIGFGILQLLTGRFDGVWLALIGWFILQAGAASAVHASLRQGLGDLAVRDVMTRDVQVVEAGTSVADLIERYFTRYLYGGYPVVRNGRPVGLVALQDLRKVSADRRGATPVEAIMTPLTDAAVVDPNTPVFDAFNRMLSTNAGRLLVLEDGRLVGLITTRGIVHLAQVKASLNA